MKSGFNANVPARKPRTRIGQVLTELTSEAEEANGDAAEAQAAVLVETELADEREPAAHAGETPAEAEAQPTSEPVGPGTARAKTPSRPSHGSERLAAGHERVSSLRERLAAAARAPVAGAEPKRTAAAVLEVVEDLRDRLDLAIRERSEMAEGLDEMRGALARAQAELDKERKAREVVEARRDESARIAEEAVTEAEALASERDQVLSELAEQRRLDDEQAALLLEAEDLIARRDAERAAAAKEAAALRAQLEARAVEIADLESQLQAADAEKSRVEARCRELEAEVAELTEAREALDAIEATVNRRS